MILAAGLTPAWQQIVVIDALSPGAVHRAREVHWCASGKCTNVALALHALSADVQSLSVIGGASGDRIRAEFAAAALPATWIESESPTRVCTTIVEQSGTTTELVENAGAIKRAQLDHFRSSYSALAAVAKLVVLSGSLAPGTPDDFYARLLESAPSRVILDARGPELLEALEYRPYLVKPNREELARTVGHGVSSQADLIAAMREMNHRGAQHVVITDGPRAVWIGSSDALYRIVPQSIQPVNAIASGDCLAAGIAWGISQGVDLPCAVQRGVACAIENALTLLPARLKPEKVLARAKDLIVERIE